NWPRKRRGRSCIRQRWQPSPYTPSRRLLRLIGDPHGRRPDELAVGLFAADIVVALLAGFGFLVGPTEFAFGLIGLSEDVLDIVFDERDLGEGGGADQFDLHRRRLAAREIVAHHVLLATGGAAIVGDDVVGG